MNEAKAMELIKYAYRTIRIVKEIKRGNRSGMAIAEKCNAPTNLVHYYLKLLTKTQERSLDGN